MSAHYSAFLKSWHSLRHAQHAWLRCHKFDNTTASRTLSCIQYTIWFSFRGQFSILWPTHVGTWFAWIAAARALMDHSQMKCANNLRSVDWICSLTVLYALWVRSCIELRKSFPQCVYLEHGERTSSRSLRALRTSPEFCNPEFRTRRAWKWIRHVNALAKLRGWNAHYLQFVLMSPKIFGHQFELSSNSCLSLCGSQSPWCLGSDASLWFPRGDEIDCDADTFEHDSTPRSHVRKLRLFWTSYQIINTLVHSTKKSWSKSARGSSEFQLL